MIKGFLGLLPFRLHWLVSVLMCSDIPILGNGILDIGIKNFNILLTYSVENNYKQAKWESGAAYETGQEW